MLRCGLLILATMAAFEGGAALLAAIDDEGSPVPSDARFLSGRLDFQLADICDNFTAHFLSVGTASNLAGPTRVVPGCNSLPGGIFGSLAPLDDGFRMAFHWVVSDGSSRHFSCDLDGGFSGTCFDDRGRASHLTAQRSGQVAASGPAPDSGRTSEPESAPRFFTAGPLSFAITDYFPWQTMTLNFPSNGRASTVAGLAEKQFEPTVAGVILGTLVPVGNDFRMVMRWMQNSGRVLKSMSCNVNAAGAGVCFTDEGRSFGISVRRPGGPSADGASS